MPEDLPLVVGNQTSLPNPVKKADRLTKAMRAVGEDSFKSLRWKIYNGLATSEVNWLPEDIYLPDGAIKLLLDRFVLIQEEADLVTLLKDRLYALEHIQTIWNLVSTLRETFSAMRKEAKKTDVFSPAEKPANVMVEGREVQSIGGSGIALQDVHVPKNIDPIARDQGEGMGSFRVEGYRHERSAAAPIEATGTNTSRKRAATRNLPGSPLKAARITPGKEN